MFSHSVLVIARDIMREVSYDPHMGEMLTYHNNKAIDWAWFRGRSVLRKYHRGSGYAHVQYKILTLIIVFF